MTETVSVSISGIAFSFISYENIKCDSNQEGFLLGEFISKETNHVTDAEHTVVNKQNIIKIKSVIPCPHQFYFYNAAGQLDISKLNRILGNQKEKVVGWYLFKHKQIAPPKLTLREKIIHKQIAKSLQLPLPLFTTCLLTLKTSNTNATYSFSQTFLRYHMSNYDSLPLHVENLTLPNYSYKLPEPMPNVLTKVIKSIKTSNPESHIFIQKIQEGLQCHMNYLLEESIDKEEQLFKLEEEIKHLRRKLMLSCRYGDKLENLNDDSFVGGDCSFEDTNQICEEVTENNKKRRGRQRKNVSPIQSTYNMRSTATINDEGVLHERDVSYSSATKRKNAEKKQ
ncbi:hypothetical protein RI129_000976 [Pyrocoelia pectoralis]|uniref:Uncharacterized protein n=1 Tax=Pyrocoelia pectoralis TaxID=417401 RepID=A0AAN7VJX2_9COLE